MQPSVNVVAHTHWDREWYEPYPVFRFRLVELLDELLPRLERDEELSHFQLDGQMAVVDDYLEVRPGEEARLRELSRSGRLSMGPWYVLPDEFLVSGETLVRDLQLGLARAADFGGAMRVGYLPDMFGHIAQMPQLLSLFGLRDAVVWRGVPSSITSPAFDWASPDGSEVRAEYLAGGYGNGSDMPEDPRRLSRRIDAFVSSQGSLVGDPVLWMAGMDHEAPPAHLGRTVAALDASGAMRARVVSLEQHLAEVSRVALPRHDGELRSGARANLLMGVNSNRVDVKIAAARAERSLERLAEPLDALWQRTPGRWSTLLEHAWLDVIRNAAHDSICACSHDEVVDAVLHRYAEATRTARQVAERALRDAGNAMAAPGVHLVNPGARDRDEVVELTVSLEQLDELDDPAGSVVQVLDRQDTEQELHRCGAADAPVVVGREALFEHPDTAAIRLARSEPGLLVAHLLPEAAEGALSRGAALGELGLACADDAELVVSTVLHRARPTARILARSGAVPGFGWRRWEPLAPDAPVVVEGHGPETVVDNGQVRVAVDPSDASFSINDLHGLGRLVDSGDAGDSYNWCPPSLDRVVDRPETVSVHCDERGPLRARLRVEATYALPAEVHRLRPADEPAGGRAGWQRIGSVQVPVTTMIEVRAGEPFVRVEHRFTNTARDHRLRAHLPLPARATHSDAECAFAVVRRGLAAEGGPNEWGVPTFPSRRFVGAGGLWVTHVGLCEYELVDLDGDPHEPGTTAGELALTLVRSTGWLSRGPMASRPLPAGPEHRLEGAQLQRPLVLRYAVSVAELDPHELAERTWSPLLAVDSTGDGTRAAVGSDLTVRGMEVDSLRREAGALVLRGHEPHGRPGRLEVDGRHGVVVDLTGSVLATFDGSMQLRSHQIVTVRLDERRADA